VEGAERSLWGRKERKVTVEDREKRETREEEMVVASQKENH
jgi:hypothetical protein